MALQNLDQIGEAEAFGERRRCIHDDSIALALGFILSEIPPAEQRIAQPSIGKRLVQVFLTNYSFCLPEYVEDGVAGNADEIGAAAGLRNNGCSLWKLS